MFMSDSEAIQEIMNARDDALAEVKRLEAALDTAQRQQERRDQTNLESLKTCYDAIGISYSETKSESGYTFISLRHPRDVEIPCNLRTDQFIEFDEEGRLSSY